MRDRPRTASVLVGRDGELAELLAGLDSAAGGSGRLFLLAGDPGIGKSRLAGEAAARARDRGIKVAWGRCWEAGGAPAYWPWVQALRALVRGVDSEELRAQLGAGAPFVAQIVAEVAEILPDVRPPPPMGAEAARFRLFDAVAAFLRNAGAGQPLMLVLDDLHAADAPSILLLRFAARELGDARVLVMGAYRDIELDRGHPLAVALVDLSREPATRHVPLSGLDEADVAGLVQEITGVMPRESVVAAVYRCTEGNPLFVGEVARLLAAEGRLERAGDPAGLALAIPEGIREVIGRRVARLPERCGRVLGLASVFGRDFWLPALEQRCGVGAGELLDVLDDGITAGLVAAVPGAPGRLRFSHALIRDALYEVHPGRRSGFGCTSKRARPWRRFTGRTWTRTWPSWPIISSRRRRAAAPARRSATPSGPGDARWCCWPTKKRSGCSRWPWPRSAWPGRPGRTRPGAGCCSRWVMR